MLNLEEDIATTSFNDLLLQKQRISKEKREFVLAMYPQTRFKLYHHAFLVTEDGKWAVIQQGLCDSEHSARRYHWLSENVHGFVEDPQSAVACDTKRAKALNMTTKASEDARTSPKSHQRN